MDILTASIRDPDRPIDQLTAEEQDEAARTFYVKRHGLGGGLRAALATLIARPQGFLSGLKTAIRAGGFDLARLARNQVYFGQALILGEWMQQQCLTHIHVQYSSMVGLLLSKTFPVGLSISFHGPDEFLDPEGFRLREKIEACVFVRAISSYSRSQLMKSCEYPQWSKIESVYLGVDVSVFAPRPFRAAPDPIEILCVGRLSPVKAQHVLVDVAGILRARGRRVLVRLVGGGPDRATLERHIRELGLEKEVVLHGFTPQSELDELYRHADIFALASFAEGLPGVLMEAMALEIPCVSTAITGTPELIEHGVDGLLVPPSDTLAFADAVDKLIQDPEFRERVGKAARRKIETKFNLAVNGAMLLDLFQRRLAASNSV